MSFRGGGRAVFWSFVALFAAVTSAGAEDTGVWQQHVRQAPTGTIKYLSVLPDGRIVTGEEDEICYFDRTRWEKTKYDFSVLLTQVPLFADSSGKLYFNNDYRLAILDGSTVTTLDSVAMYEPASFAEGADSLYIGIYNPVFGGLFVLDGERKRKIHTAQVRSLAIDRGGNIWMTGLPSGGTATRLLMRGNGLWSDRTAEISSILPLNWGEVDLRVNAAPDGTVWVVYNGSYAVLDNGVWTISKSPGGGSPNMVTFDSSGRVWGYSSDNGILYLRNTSGGWSTSRAYGTPPTIQGFLAVAPDSTLFTCDGDSLFQYTGGKWKGVEDPYDLGSNVVTTVACVGDKILCGHGFRERPYDRQSYSGLSIYDGATWRNIRTSGTNKLNNVFLIRASQDDDVAFIYSDEGAYFYDGDTLTATVDSISIFEATDACWDNDRVLWISTTDGLIQYFDPGVALWSVTEYCFPILGVAVDQNRDLYMQTIGDDGRSDRILFMDATTEEVSDSITYAEDVNDIAIDADNILWGARINELSWWDTDWAKWVDVTTFPDSNRIVQIDGEGRIWSSSYGKTGYYQDGTFHAISDLSGIAADAIGFSPDGGVAVNAFNSGRTEYYGLYEYVPPGSGVEDTEQPVSFIAGEAYPNPFNPAVTIRFTLPAAGMAQVQVYSITGQRVRMLANRMFPAGVTRLVWDSTDDFGKHVSSGVYFYRVTTGKQSYSGKMTLLR